MLNNQHNPLPRELELALRRATDRTLTALASLRHAVREHVHQERAGGNDLDEIQLQLRAIVARALDGVPPAEHTDGGHHARLTRQIIQWSSGFYTEKKTQ